MSAPKIVFLDVETTGLDPAQHEIWEIALIERDPGDRVEAEHHWFLKPKHLKTADPAALALNRFYERTRDFKPQALESTTTGVPGSAETKAWTGDRFVSGEVARITSGAVLVGSNPAFDAAMLANLLKANDLVPAWHYRPIDVATLAYGYEIGAAAEAANSTKGDLVTVQLPDEAQHPRISSERLAASQDIPKPQGKSAHTAMADARWAMRWYDALIGGAA